MTSLSRRDFAGLLAGAPLCAQQQRARPNILLIVTDDQGWWDLGCHGNRDIETPNMDRLSREGVEFTRFYVSPVCAPTRASLMTGRHYLRTGVYNTRFGGDNMEGRETTLAELLRGAGYRTGIVGKWHLGRYRATDPLSQGFDDGFWCNQGHLERYYYPDQLYWNRRPVRARGYITRLLTDQAMQFIDQSPASRPWFLYLAYNAPHEPQFVDQTYVTPYLKKGLPLKEAYTYGMVTCVDDHIGRLLKHLDGRGKREETVVVFLSDNGGVSSHYRAGLRGAKGSAYEGGIRSPLFVRWPGRFPAGAKTSAMAAHIDMLPTLCEVAGVKAPAVDGKSILSILRAGKGETPHEYLYHIWDRFRPSLQSNWSIGTKRYKLVRNQLFDLETDPGEATDVAAKHPEIASQLRKEFERWLAEVTRGRNFEPPPIEVGRVDENPVEIQASWALTDGTHMTMTPPGGDRVQGPDPLPSAREGSTVNYTFAGYDWDTIDGWRKPGEKARWRLQVTETGEYEITLAYGCDSGGGGGRFRVAIGSAAMEGTVETTGGRNVFEQRVVGTLRIPKGPATLEVSVVESGGRELMALNRIWLRRM